MLAEADRPITPRPEHDRFTRRRYWPADSIGEFRRDPQGRARWVGTWHFNRDGGEELKWSIEEMQAIGLAALELQSIPVPDQRTVDRSRRK